jgi:2-polyprenyl-3-methyl-5-hydroxy-6-metoxy-1,4-benzoquinol methylase
MQETLDLWPSREELVAIFDRKYRRTAVMGWLPRMRLDFGYFNPDDYYEAIVARLVTPGAWWADIGCGRDVFPSNPDLARELSGQCAFMFGIDPDPNIRQNRFISEGFEGMVEDCNTEYRFDLITLRMVAEHVVDPDRSVGKLAQLTKPGGLIVVYTPNKWAPVSILAALVPNQFHFRIKRLFWGGEERDTFPTAFRLNTRATLAHYFGKNGVAEVFFAYLDDCRTTNKFRRLNYVELTVQRILKSMGLRYPENCLLGVYRKQS